MKVTELFDEKEILRHKDFTAIPFTISDEIEIDGKFVRIENGLKIVKAGTPFSGLLEGDDIATEVANDETAEGLLRYDVVVDYKPAPASLVIRGDVYKDKVPNLSEEAIKAMETRMLVIG